MLDKTDKLLSYYENMVNWESRLSREGPFIANILSRAGAGRVLDCGCGIGRHVIWLRKNGFDAHGSDLNPIHIEKARETARRESPGAGFFLEDMMELSGREDGSFDAVTSLGNTLSSLGREGAGRAFAAFHRVLKPGGVLIGQVLNYQSFNREDRSEVRSAIIDRAEVVYVKTFHFEEDRLLMVINVLSKEGEKWEAMVHSTNMYFLNREYMEDTLAKSGFGEIEIYGSLSGDPFENGKSRDLIFVGRKVARIKKTIPHAQGNGAGLRACHD